MVGVATAPVAGATALVTGRLLPTGGELNTAIAARKLGSSARVFGRVGDDLFGQYIKRRTTQGGVLAEGLVESPWPTGISVVLTSRAERSFIYHPGCNDEFCIDDVDLVLLGMSRCVHFSDPFELPNFIRNAPQLPHKLARCGCVLSMDACWDPSSTWLSAIQDCPPYLDLFFCNRAESERRTQCPLPEDW